MVKSHGEIEQEQIKEREGVPVLALADLAWTEANPITRVERTSVNLQAI